MDDFSYQMGFDAGVRFMLNRMGEGFSESLDTMKREGLGYTPGRDIGSFMKKERLGKHRPKRRKSKKVKVLDEMAKKAWNKYKKGSGKKTYIQIRAQVSRSQAYKKKVKNL